MKPVRMLIAGMVLGVISQAALAFQETGATKAESAQQQSQSGADMNLSTPDASAKTRGPEIRIPGLGAIGTLPKLDFGLELLYGATERGVREDKNEPGDVQIRGTLKYRFPN